MCWEYQNLLLKVSWYQTDHVTDPVTEVSEMTSAGLGSHRISLMDRGTSLLFSSYVLLGFCRQGGVCGALLSFYQWLFKLSAATDCHKEYTIPHRAVVCKLVLGCGSFSFFRERNFCVCDGTGD
jgi:hypothetical protein